MRDLTLGEATVIRSALASDLGSERERLHRTQLPATTYQRGRQRAYAEGWVFDRYVPDPVRLGCSSITFALVQPFADRRRELQARWEANPNAVLLWCWPETLFGVFWSRGPGDVLPIPSEKGWLRTEFTLTADPRQPEIPSYFDWEGAWSRLMALRGSYAYPHSLPPVISRSANPSSLSDSDRQGLALLMNRSLDRPPEGEPLRVSPFFLPRSQQRLLGRGMVEQRTFLDPKTVPRYNGRGIERLVFLQGTLRVGASPERLFHRLTSIQVYPVLFATDRSKVLMTTLSPAPPPGEPGLPKMNVLANLEEFLESIQVEREPVGSLEVPVNHRYDRLLTLPAR